MKTISWYWNLLHYNFFLWQKNAHRIFNYINPIRYFLKIPSVKKFYAKHGIDDMNKFSDDKIFNNKKVGINSIRAGVNMGGVFILLEYIIFNLIQIIISKPLIKYVWEEKTNFILFVIILLGIAGLFNYFTLFKNDRYLTYFKEFEKMSDSQKRKYQIFSSISVVIIITLFFISSLCIRYR